MIPRKIKINEVRELQKSNIGKNERVESLLEAFDTSLKKIQQENYNFLKTSVKTTLQLFFDVGVFDIFRTKDENFQD